MGTTFSDNRGAPLFDTDGDLSTESISVDGDADIVYVEGGRWVDVNSSFTDLWTWYLDAPIEVHDGEVSLTGTVLDGFNNEGLLCDRCAAVTLTDVTARNHGSHGLEILDYAGPSPISLQGCAVDDNSGNGVYTDGALRIVDSGFEGNGATRGGAIRTSADIEVESSRFTGNSAGDGGAIYATSDSVRITDSTFVGNVSSGYGAVYHIPSTTAASLYIEGSHFDANTGRYGAAVWAGPGTTLIDNWFTCNDAGSGVGGAVIIQASGVTTPTVVQNNLFMDNAAATGGGLSVSSTTALALTNNTFIGNTASYSGAALYLGYSGGDVVNNLFSDNQVQPAVYADADSTADTRFSYNAFYNNYRGNESGSLTFGTLTTQTGSLASDPQIYDFTADADCSNDQVHPTASSPLIDAGDPSIQDPDGSTSDIGYTGGPSASVTDTDGDGEYAPWDCDDTDARVSTFAAELWYDGIDQNCDGSSDYDADGDGELHAGYGGADCDDIDARVNPSARETWYDGVDQDCDGANDYDADGDGEDSDRYGGADCDDRDTSVNPAASDRWYDGVDQDCNGASDYDADGDGEDSDRHGGEDCDDRDASVGSFAAEVWYDGVDQDCDGANDYDADGDGVDALAHAGTDCDDSDAGVHPGATELWYDGVDQDCDGASDYDADGDGEDAEDHGGLDCDDADAGVGVDGEGCEEKTGCASRPGAPLGLAALVGLGLVLGRRRRP